MTPADVSTIQAALLALLTAILAALAPIVALRVNAWLDALSKDKQLSGAADLAHAIVRGVEQGFQGAAGPAKKDAAVAALTQALPWLPAGTASVLVEAAVLAMNDLQDMRATSTSVATVTPLEPATLLQTALPVQRLEIFHSVAPPPPPPAEPPAPAIALPPGLSGGVPSAPVVPPAPEPSANGTAAPEVTATISPV